jgi:hypothetical protein
MLPEAKVISKDNSSLVSLVQGIAAQRQGMVGNVLDAVKTGANIGQTIYQDAREYDATKYKTNNDFIQQAGVNPQTGQFSQDYLQAKAIADPAIAQAMKDNIRYQRTGSFGKELAGQTSTGETMNSIFKPGWEADPTLKHFADSTGGAMDKAEQATAMELSRAYNNDNAWKYFNDMNHTSEAADATAGNAMPQQAASQAQTVPQTAPQGQATPAATPQPVTAQQVAPTAIPAATSNVAAPTTMQPASQQQVATVAPAAEPQGIEAKWNAQTPQQRAAAYRVSSMASLPVSAEGKLPDGTVADIKTGRAPTMTAEKLDKLRATPDGQRQIAKAYANGLTEAGKMLKADVNGDLGKAWSGITNASASPAGIAAAKKVLGISGTDEQVKTAFLGMKEGIAHTVLDNGVNNGNFSIPVKNVDGKLTRQIYLPAIMKDSGTPSAPVITPIAEEKKQETAKVQYASPVQPESWTAIGVNADKLREASMKQATGQPLTSEDHKTLAGIRDIGAKMYKEDLGTELPGGGTLADKLRMSRTTLASREKAFKNMNGYNVTPEQMFLDPSIKNPADVTAQFSKGQQLKIANDQNMQDAIKTAVTNSNTLLNMGYTRDSAGAIVRPAGWQEAFDREQNREDRKVAIMQQNANSTSALSGVKATVLENKASGGIASLSTGEKTRIMETPMRLKQMAIMEYGVNPNADQLKEFMARPENAAMISNYNMLTDAQSKILNGADIVVAGTKAAASSSADPAAAASSAEADALKKAEAAKQQQQTNSAANAYLAKRGIK